MLTSGCMPSDNHQPEMTVKAVGLGLLLAFVFGSANAYLGMKAGQTVAATIPAAVIALALFRLPRFKGGVLEQNIARTAASVGEALVAGAIFTIPAFLLADVGGTHLWTDLKSHYWQASFILLAGGLIGVFFIILLRRPLCVEAGLPFPESVASANIVKAGDRASDAPRYLFGAMGFGALIQVLKSDSGLTVFREFTQGFLAFPRSVVQHFDFNHKPLGQVVHGGGIPWTTPSLSPALIGIGYIIGPRLAAINGSGGIIAWWVIIPLLLFFDPDLPRRLGVAGSSWDVISFTVWYNIVRPMAVGTMLVGACHTLFSMRSSIIQSLKGAFVASTEAAHEGAAIERTEKDIAPKWVLIGILALLVPIVGIYYYFTHGLFSAIIAALVMTVIGFLLSAVGGYLVGLVGSSNQPVSGLTLAALVVAALVMLAMGVKGLAGVGAVLGVAAVVCCACCVSGSLIQDLKAGHARRHALEDGSHRDCHRNPAGLLSDGTDHRAAPGEPGDGWDRRARAAGTAGRPDGAARQRDCGRADGLGADRHRRGLRRGVDLLRRRVTHVGCGGYVPAVRDGLFHFRGGHFPLGHRHADGAPL